MEDLKNFKYNLKQIKRLEDKIIFMRESMNKTMSMGHITGQSLETVTNKWNTIYDLEMEYSELIAEFSKKCLHVEKILKDFEDQRLATILRLYYLDGLTFEKVRLQMNYSFKHIGRLFNLATKEYHNMATNVL